MQQRTLRLIVLLSKAGFRAHNSDQDPRRIYLSRGEEDLGYVELGDNGWSSEHVASHWRPCVEGAACRHDSAFA